MTFNWVEIAMTVLTTGLFSLVGFVWRFSHKVTKLEQDYESIKSRLRRMENEHDKVMDRVYSLAKSRHEFMNK